MKTTDYKSMYKKIFEILGELTPLNVDCGVLCECACCKGDGDQGMLLFPHEESEMPIKYTDSGKINFNVKCINKKNICN